MTASVDNPTAPLVRGFMDRMKDIKFEKRFKSEFLPANDMAIHAFLERNTNTLFQQLERLSAFQAENFTGMIPVQYHDFMKESLEHHIPVKLLGSGGGGFLLAFVRDGLHLPENIKSLKVF